ncbi:MAG: NUDIX hydrolase [Thermodesulfobacteriota bacterium]
MSRAVVLSRKEIHRGRILDIGIERVRLPSGAETDLEVIRHPGAAAVVPLTERGEILLLHQFRHAVDGMLWEIPAGTLASGESPRDCALRELVEEAGTSAGELLDLGEVVPAPGYTTERIRLFLARSLTPASQNLDDDEVIAEVRPVPVEDVVRKIADGEIVDAKSVVAICRAHERGLLGAGARRRG